MRIKLKKGKQEELILLVKKGKSWLELASILKVSPIYLRNELRHEQRTLTKEIYNNLCKIAKVSYNKEIENNLDDNWGRSKGGKNSEGNTKFFNPPSESEKLAEFFGIIFGDGHIDSYKKGRKIRCYIVKIAGDLHNDYDYLSIYVFNLVKKLFSENPSIRKVPSGNEVFLNFYGKKIINFLESKGLKAGNKKQNNQGIPRWIFSNEKYLSACIRGLIDTDGSVHYISKNNRNIRISFTSFIPALLSDVHVALNEMEIRTSKIISKRQIFISSKSDVKRYIQKIGFNNPKHLRRLELLNYHAPVV